MPAAIVARPSRVGVLISLTLSLMSWLAASGCPGTTAPWRWTRSLFKRRLEREQRDLVWVAHNCAHTGASVALKGHAQGITTMKSVSWPVSRLRP
jgi:hypothetical protein